MKIYVFLALIFSVNTLLAANCFDNGAPGWLKGSVCKAERSFETCPSKDAQSCDYTLFGPNLCVPNNEKSVIKACAKKSLDKNFKRFHQMPSYHYLTFKSRIREIEKLCTEDSDQVKRASKCHELLLSIRELSDFFEDHLKIIEEDHDVFGPRCETHGSFPPLSIFSFDQFLPKTIYIDNPYKFKVPKIIEPDLKTNKRSDFCIRNKELIDTIVLHHTGTSNTESLERINNYHISLGWYKTGYHYIVRTSYENDGTLNSDLFYQTRNPLITGAQAGSYAYEEKKPTKSELKKISCYTTSGYPKETKNIVNSQGFIKANSTTIGIAVMGNFSPIGPLSPNGRRDNPTGFPNGDQRNLNNNTVTRIAELMCHLQEKYPNLKKLKKHSDYKESSCPGSIADSMSEIIKKTKEIGCDFSL